MIQINRARKREAERGEIHRNKFRYNKQGGLVTEGGNNGFYNKHPVKVSC